jgi:hypothetical protein
VFVESVFFLIVVGFYVGCISVWLSDISLFIWSCCVGSGIKIPQDACSGDNKDQIKKINKDRTIIL